MAARGSSRNRALLWGTGAVAAVALALTGYSALTGHHDDDRPAAGKGTAAAPTASAGAPSAVPTYTVPEDWTEPARWAALPRGRRTDTHGNLVGFPHSIDGAVSMLATANSSSIEGDRSTVDVQLDSYRSYLSAADHTPANEAKVRAAAATEDAALHTSMGLPTAGPLPAGAYVHTTVVGFKVITSSPDRVTAYLLTQVARKAGETAKEKSAYTVAVLAAGWQGGDWRISSAQSAAAAQQAQAGQPDVAAPGDSGFNAAGWTAIREAS